MKVNIYPKLFTKYDVKSNSVVASREQIPLVLGYSLTIHKAQGMTIEHVVVHCKGIVQPGQLSVASGRAVPSDGLSLVDCRKELCLLPRNVIRQFYSEPSSAFLDDYSCCTNLENVCQEESGSKMNVDSDSGSDLYINENDFIEENLQKPVELLDNVK